MTDSLRKLVGALTGACLIACLVLPTLCVPEARARFVSRGGGSITPPPPPPPDSGFDGGIDAGDSGPPDLGFDGGDGGPALPDGGAMQLFAGTYIGGDSDAGAGGAQQDEVVRSMTFIDGRNTLLLSGLAVEGAQTTTGPAYQGCNVGTDPFGGDFWLGSMSFDLTTLNAARAHGGAGCERPYYSCIERADNTVCCAGHTESAGITGALNAYPGGNTSGWLACYSADLTTVLAGRYVGGTGADTCRGGVMELAGGDVLCIGQAGSTSTGLGTPGVYQQTHGGGASEGIACAFSSDLATTQWCTYLGSGSGSQTEIIAAGFEEPDGDLVFLSSSPDSAWIQARRTAGANASGTQSLPFLARLSAGATTLEALVPIGPEGQTVVGPLFQEPSVVQAPDGSYYVAGTTEGAIDFGSFAANQQVAAHGLSPTNLGRNAAKFQYDCVLAKISADLSSVLWSTHLGGAGSESCGVKAVDSFGNAILSGDTDSQAWITSLDGAIGPLNDATINGGSAGWAATVSADGTRVLAFVLIDSVGDDLARSVLHDPNGEALVVGAHVGGTGAPVTTGAFDETHNENLDHHVSIWAPWPEFDAGPYDGGWDGGVDAGDAGPPDLGDAGVPDSGFLLTETFEAVGCGGYTTSGTADCDDTTAPVPEGSEQLELAGANSSILRDGSPLNYGGSIWWYSMSFRYTASSGFPIPLIYTSVAGSQVSGDRVGPQLELNAGTNTLTLSCQAPGTDNGNFATLSANTTYDLVIKFDNSTGTSNVEGWLNPTALELPGTPDVSLDCGTYGSGPVSWYYQHFANGNFARYDNLRISESTAGHPGGP